MNSEPLGVRAQLAQPAFIVTAARSGSTLLRYLLDAHSQIVVPPESNIAEAAAALMRSWTIHWDQLHAAERRERARREVRRCVSSFIRYHCEQARKPLFCDKSLTTADNYEPLLEAFPRARFITLYRHAMDMIASGIEMSRWGYEGYGFARFVPSTNFPAGLASYWCHVTGRMLDLERTEPRRCLRVHYENLVVNTTPVLRDILSFLQLGWEDGIVERGLSEDHQSGLGDSKIDFTQKPHSASIGRGICVPAKSIPQELRKQMNEQLSALGYPLVEEDWNDQPSPLGSLRRGWDTPSPAAIEALLSKNISGAPAGKVRRLVVIVEEHEGAWVVDFDQKTVQWEKAACSDDVAVIARADVYHSIALGTVNPGLLLISNEIRVRGDPRERQSVLRQLYKLLATSRVS